MGWYRKMIWRRALESLDFTGFIVTRWGANKCNYYVYQSTPYDLYGTPDFSSISRG
jgi:hypothetical protein